MSAVRPLSVPNSFAVPMENRQGRRFAISDIHGCARTLYALIDKIGLTTQDQLFLLGDYINKGPDSKGVLDFILKLKQKKYQIFALRGNHEEILIQSQQKILIEKQQNTYPNYPTYPNTRKLKNILDERGLLLPQYRDFFYNLDYYFEINNFLLVHAGFDFSQANPFLDKQKMLWTRYFEPDIQVVGNKRIIHGHVPEYLQFIKDDIEYGNPVICIDNGCVHHTRKAAGLGNLVALDLDQMDIIAQENIEFRKQFSIHF
ncbi:metallophosphoesterase family protein [Hugenholtzia roseola]|uniref:metallophosphoesterase family protein n=1 Tax=Hugenholtzia roseola TaxID=1002 RepID=UPI0003F92CF2|nr:metallophosphoesterase family protein [Hugenholtzia roseola]